MDYRKDYLGVSIMSQSIRVTLVVHTLSLQEVFIKHPCHKLSEIMATFSAVFGSAYRHVGFNYRLCQCLKKRVR